MKSFKKKLNCLSAIPAVSGVTLNLCTGTEKRKKLLINKYGIGMESMEGAAFFHACAMVKIPALQIRSVSNKTGKRERNKWKITEALDALQGFTGLLMMELETINL